MDCVCDSEFESIIINECGLMIKSVKKVENKKLRIWEINIILHKMYLIYDTQYLYYFFCYNTYYNFY